MRKITEGELVSEIAARQSGTRARNFEQWPPRSPLIIYKSGVRSIFVAFFLYLSGYVVNLIRSDTTDADPLRLIENAAFFISYWGALAALLYGVGSLVYAFVQRKRLHRQLDEEYQERRVIYSRLRYVAAENIVFDPATGEEAPAQHLEGLISFVNRTQKAK